jgi:hypothetical protein
MLNKCAFAFLQLDIYRLYFLFTLKDFSKVI